MSRQSEWAHRDPHQWESRPGSEPASSKPHRQVVGFDRRLDVVTFMQLRRFGSWPTAGVSDRDDIPHAHAVGGYRIHPHWREGALARLLPRKSADRGPAIPWGYFHRPDVRRRLALEAAELPQGTAPSRPVALLTPPNRS